MTITELNRVAQNLGRDFVSIVEAGVRWFRILVFPRLRQYLGNWVDGERLRMDQIVMRARLGMLTEEDLYELAVVLGAVPPRSIGAYAGMPVERSLNLKSTNPRRQSRLPHTQPRRRQASATRITLTM